MPCQHKLIQHIRRNRQMQEGDNNGKRVLELKVVLLGLIKSCSCLSESEQLCYDGVKLKCSFFKKFSHFHF